MGAPHSLAEVFANAESGRVQSFELPVQASLRSTNRRERIESPNVVAVLRGSDPRLREEYVVLSAHLDHVGVGDPVDGTPSMTPSMIPSTTAHTTTPRVWRSSWKWRTRSPAFPWRPAGPCSSSPPPVRKKA